MRVAGAFALLGLVFLWHCSDRARDNPLDPLNPGTGGKPFKPILSSEKKVVFVSWRDLDNNSITGYRIWRRMHGQDPEPLSTVSRASTHYKDTVSYYDTTFIYQVSALTETYETSLSPADSIITGPFNYWVADFFRGSLSVVTYDGAHLLRENYAGSPVAVVPDPYGPFVWVATFYPSGISKQTLEGEEVFSQELDSFPADIAVDPQTGNIWTIPVGSAHILQFNPNAGTIDTVSTAVSLTLESRLDVGPSGDYVWVTVPDSNKVLKIKTLYPHEIQIISIEGTPRAVIATATPDMTWLATNSGLVGIDSENKIQRYLTEYSVVDLDVHLESQAVWMIGYDSRAQTTNVWTMTYGNGIGTPTPVDLPESYLLSRIRVNPGSDHPGILVYDLIGGQLVRLDRVGNVIGKLEGFSSRLDIAIQK